MGDDKVSKIAIRNPVSTGFLFGLGVAAAFSLVAVVWFAVTAIVDRQTMEKAKNDAEVEKAYAAVQKQHADATRQRAEEMVGEEEAERRAEQAKASARQSAIDGLKVDVASIDRNQLFLSLRNTSPFAIKAARLKGVVTFQGNELARGEFDAIFDRRILQDQIADVELPANVLWKSIGDSITNDVDVKLEVIDITFRMQ